MVVFGAALVGTVLQTELGILGEPVEAFDLKVALRSVGEVEGMER